MLRDEKELRLTYRGRAATPIARDSSGKIGEDFPHDVTKAGVPAWLLMRTWSEDIVPRLDTWSKTDRDRMRLGAEHTAQVIACRATMNGRLRVRAGYMACSKS